MVLESGRVRNHHHTPRQAVHANEKDKPTRTRTCKRTSGFGQLKPAGNGRSDGWTASFSLPP
jgi:hypothetical protein